MSSDFLKLPCEELLKKIDTSYEHFLDKAERAKAIKFIAEKGIDNLQEFIRQEEKLSQSFHMKLSRIRRLVQSQIQKAIMTLGKDYDARKMDLKNKYAEKKKIVLLDLNKLYGEMKKFDAGLDALISDAISKDADLTVILEKEPAKKNLWHKFVELLRKIWLLIKLAFLRLFGKLRIRSLPRKKKKVVLLSYPSLTAFSATLGKIVSITTHPFSQKVDAQLLKEGFSKFEIEYKKMYQKDEYEAYAKTYFEDKLESVAKRVLAKRKKTAKKIRKLKAEQQKLEDAANKELSALEAEKKEKIKQLEAETDKKTYSTAEQKIKNEFQEMGFLTEKEGNLEVTYALVEQFASIVLAEELKHLPTQHRQFAMSGDINTGIYEKSRYRHADELAKIDLVSSLVDARLHGSRELSENNTFVYKEIFDASPKHVVILFDKSGSMYENNRILAAKKAVLALYKAIKMRDKFSTVDLVAFDNNVEIMDLYQVWNCIPRGFTNTGEAFYCAKNLLTGGRAAQKHVYFVTDGLPEAYTSKEGVKVGDLKKSLDYALTAAKELKKIRNLKVTIILLEPKDMRYVVPAKLLAETLDANLIYTSPASLAKDMLLDFMTA